MTVWTLDGKVFPTSEQAKEYARKTNRHQSFIKSIELKEMLNHLVDTKRAEIVHCQKMIAVTPKRSTERETYQERINRLSAEISGIGECLQILWLYDYD